MARTKRVVRMRWRLWLSAVVCAVAIASAFHVFLLDPMGVPDNGLRVTETDTEDGGRDWIIRLYGSVGAGAERQRWRAVGEDYRIDIQRRGESGFVLDIAYRSASQGRHRVRQQVRLAEGPTLVAAFGQTADGGETRIIVDRVK